MTLDRLLTRAGLSRYEQWEWFRGCTLEKTIILVPDEQLAASLRRCWLPQILAVLPDCTIRVGEAKAKPAAYRGQDVAPKAQGLW